MHAAERNRIATSYLPRIQKIARGIARHLPASIDAEDLASVGTVGMMTALDSFDAARGDSLELYVMRRVRGAILDELRARDPLSRDQRRDAKAVRAAQRALESELGRDPEEHEVARRARVDVERLREVRRLAAAVTPTSIAGAMDFADPRSANPIEMIALGQARESLAVAIEALPERERLILALYYVEELSLKEIGGILGVTESRVCQIHGSAVKKLRTALLDA